MMKVAYTVHRCNRSSQDALVTLASGQQVTASVPVVEAELVSADGAHGTVTLRFMGEEADAAAELFTKDAVIEAEFGAAA